jgi:glycosyltransferase involved in cell wall biosynthesis
MMSKRIRVAWLAPYPVTRLQPELTIVRQPRLEHPVSWIGNLADALATRDDIDLHIVAASAAVSANQTVRRNGIEFSVVRHAVPFTCRGFSRHLRLDLWSRYAYLRWQLRRVVQRLQPDVIHVHGTEYGYGLAALDTGVPTIVSIQGIVSLLAQMSPTSAFRLQALIEQRVIANTPYVGCRTEWAADFVRDVNPAATVYQMNEAINDVFFRNSGEPAGTQRIVMVGEIVRRKGVEEAIEAMPLVVSAFPSATLAIVGPGGSESYVDGLKERTRSLGIDANVEWLGFRPASEIAALHAGAVLLIHPSHIDNSPNAVAEAMASGLAVIASKVGGIPSMIEHDVTGLLVEPRSHIHLAEAIIALLRDEPKRRRLAGNARKVALERHLPANTAEQTMRVYRDIIAREGVRRGATPDRTNQSDRLVIASSHEGGR